MINLDIARRAREQVYALRYGERVSLIFPSGKIPNNPKEAISIASEELYQKFYAELYYVLWNDGKYARQGG